VFPPEKFPTTGLSRDRFLTPEGLEYWGEISLLKAGIVYSDLITTVSPTYAQEIQTDEYGMGMHGVLQHRAAFLHGILNGVDYSLWDPATDSHIPANYTPEEIAGKRRCKESLIRELGLEKSLVKRPLLGVVSRLDTQKGFDLLAQTVNEIIELDVGLVILGLGDDKIREAIEAAVQHYPDHVCLKLAFDESLSHRIMAGSDLFLIPSRYEPCGLTQMYALKYGTVPLVRATGGLEDTVSQFDPQTGTGNGLKFGPYEPRAFLEAVKEGINLFEDTRLWGQLMTNGMKMDFSWHRSAQRYLKLYQAIVEGSS
jgi:starch synthase